MQVMEFSVNMLTTGGQRLRDLERAAKQAKIGITLLSDLNKTVTKAYDVVFPNLAGIGDTSARAAFVIGKDGVVKYAEQTPTPKDLPNFAAVKAALAG